MHLLAAAPGAVDDGSEAIDLGQTPGDIVVLTSADTEIAALSAVHGARSDADPNTPSLRLANTLRLGHNMSVDLYVETVVQHAKLVVCRLLGGRGYWTYGVDEIAAACRAANIPVAFLPGDDQPDAELASLSTLPAGASHRLWQYLVHGGIANADQFLAFAANTIGHTTEWREPAPLMRAGLYWTGRGEITRDALQALWIADAPVAGIVFYRALMQAANLAPVDALIHALREKGLNPLPVYAASLKDPGRLRDRLRGLRCSAPGRHPQHHRLCPVRPRRRDRPRPVRRNRCPGAAGGLRRVERGGLARGSKRAVGARYRHERRAARSGRAHPVPRGLL